MNFNFQLVGTLRMLLFPFSLLYFLAVWFRNRLYDKNIIHSISFNLPVICVGNLSVGGTGKSPMVEYLVMLLQNDVAVATLSRGYKRKTKGYALAGDSSTALEIGDEPMQFHNKFPRIAVSVGEERLEAIPQLLHDRPETGVILLDDAFQHRRVKAGLNILLVDCNNLYTRDWYLPTGSLRDEKNSVKRADVVIVTKCKKEMSIAEKDAVVAELKLLPQQQLYFSSIRYATPYHIITRVPHELHKTDEVLLVTGIANPAPLKNLLDQAVDKYEQLRFRDHQVFTIDDLKRIMNRFEEMPGASKIILTTEKDAVRLIKFENVLNDAPLFVIPIASEFLFNGTAAFDQNIKEFIHQFNYTPQ